MAERPLAIEDDPAALWLMSHRLESESNQIIPAVSSPEGLRKAQKEAPGPVVLDVTPLGIDRVEVCHQRRSGPAASRGHLSILTLTAKSQEANRATGEKVGADLYLPRPTTPGEITAAVRSLLAPREDRDA